MASSRRAESDARDAPAASATAALSPNPVKDASRRRRDGREASAAIDASSARGVREMSSEVRADSAAAALLILAVVVVVIPARARMPRDDTPGQAATARRVRRGIPRAMAASAASPIRVPDRSSSEMTVAGALLLLLSLLLSSLPSYPLVVIIVSSPLVAAAAAIIIISMMSSSPETAWHHPRSRICRRRMRASARPRRWLGETSASSSSASSSSSPSPSPPWPKPPRAVVRLRRRCCCCCCC